MARKFAHAAKCPDPTAEPEPFVGHLGDPMLGCPRCKAFKVTQAAPAPVAPARPLASVAPLVSRYRCRTHPGTAVTWKGTGCPDCYTEATEQQAQRDAAARRRRALASA